MIIPIRLLPGKEEHEQLIKKMMLDVFSVRGIFTDGIEGVGQPEGFVGDKLG